MYKHTHVGVYGIILNDRKVLLVKKKRGPYIGKQDLPGGGIEMGENTIETLTREIKEETGYNIKESNFMDLINNRIEYINHKGQQEELTHIIIIYSVSLEHYGEPNGKNIIYDTEDTSDSKWVNINEITNIPVTPIIYYIIDKLK